MNHCKILVAEDNDNDVFILQRVLAAAHLDRETRFVRDGQEAIEFINGNDAGHLPRLFLLDLKMPRMDGFDVLRWRQLRQDLKGIPTIVFTSSEQAKDIQRAYDLGANSYLVKPGDIESLAALMTLLTRYWLGVNRQPAP